MDPLGGRGLPTRVLFGEKIGEYVCENERIGSRGGGHAPDTSQ